MKTDDVYTKTCTWKFIAVLFMRAKKVETTQVSITWWVDKQNMVSPYNWILFNNKKEWSIDSRYNMVSLENIR